MVEGLPAAFTIENDEWYTYDRSPRPDVHVLANVDENSYVPARSLRMGDHPVIWTNPHYKARNVYFQFGHKARSVPEQRVQDAVPQRDSLGRCAAALSE